MQLRALVFDDEAIVRALVSSVLHRRGYEVCEFSEPRSCPILLQNGCPCPEGYVCADVIITDVRMPAMTGLDFVENQIKRGCKARNIAVMSGAWSVAEERRARDLGCETFKKPFSKEQLISWVEQCETRIDPSRKLWDWSEYGKETNRA